MHSSRSVFDPAIEDCAEYRKSHEDYKYVVDRMLLSFEQDTGFNYKSIMNAVQEMNDKEDIRTIFQTVLEQVMSSVDFGLYVRVMTHKNIVLQEEALQMIMKNLGALPDSLTREAANRKQDKASRQKEEDAVLAAALEKSRKEFEKTISQEKMEEKELREILELSRAEAERLCQNRKVEEHKIDVALKTGSIAAAAGVASGNVATVSPVGNTSHQAHTHSSKPLTDLKSAPVISASVSKQTVVAPTNQPAVSVLSAPVVSASTHPPTVGASKVKGVSSADAAANWMKSAQMDASASVQQTERYQAMQRTMEAMSMDERQQRLAFLKEQRDKLVKMKKEEREKQLRRVESSQPQRPQSARAARAAMSGKAPEPQKKDPEAEKRLAMRKAIADRLKSEVIDRHQ